MRLICRSSMVEWFQESLKTPSLRRREAPLPRKRYLSKSIRASMSFHTDAWHILIMKHGVYSRGSDRSRNETIWVSSSFWSWIRRHSLDNRMCCSSMWREVHEARQKVLRRLVTYRNRRPASLIPSVPVQPNAPAHHYICLDAIFSKTDVAAGADSSAADVVATSDSCLIAYTQTAAAAAAGRWQADAQCESSGLKETFIDHQW